MFFEAGAAGCNHVRVMKRHYYMLHFLWFMPCFVDSMSKVEDADPSAKVTVKWLKMVFLYILHFSLPDLFSSNDQWQRLQRMENFLWFRLTPYLGGVKPSYMGLWPMSKL